MIGLIRDYIRAWRAEARSRALVARYQEAAFQNLGDLGRRYVDVDRYLYGWADGSAPADAAERAAGLATARERARRFVVRNAHARNVTTQIVNFTVGAGFGVRFEEERAEQRWRRDAQRLNWYRRRREIVRRLVRDGEVFLRRFGSELRFVEPEDVRTPPGKTDSIEAGLHSGIAFEPGDVEARTGFWACPQAASNGQAEFVPAREGFHWLDPFSDLNALRGWPIIYDAIPVIDQYERWIKGRAILNELRSAIVAIRSHRGATPAQLSAFADAVKAGTITRASGKAQKWADKWLPGTVIDATGDIEYEFPAAKIDAGSVAEDGRAMRLLICAFFSLPEYWVTADAANANFASSLVAENPGIIAMRSWQDAFAGDLRRFLAWWYGDDELQAEVVFPNLVVRDPLKLSQARALQHDHGVLSAQTWQQLEGLDPDVERERIGQESQG